MPVISYYETLLFHNAMGKHKDTFIYYPIAIAKCYEIGTKYRYFCIAMTKTYPSLPSHFAVTEIYKSEYGMPYATRLLRIPFEDISQ